MKTGDRVQVRDKGGFWTTAIYLYTTKYDRHICQSQHNWDCSNISLESWDEIKPAPRTETRVKKASEIMKWLEENGAVLDQQSDWRCVGHAIHFNKAMFGCCGKYPNKNWTWLPEWLEEVEI